IQNTVEPDAISSDLKTEQYRDTVEKLSARRHQYVHIKLKNGKVFTGLVRNVSVEGFSLRTDALGGPSVVYKDLAESPRPVRAVGTRVKRGAEWTGRCVLLIAAIPLAIAFSPWVAD